MTEHDSRSAGPPDRSFAEGLGRAIKVLRTGQDLSRKALAERAGISYSYLSEIENGEKSPSSRTLAAIAEALGRPVHELVEASETWRTPLSDEDELHSRIWSSPARRHREVEASEAPDFSFAARALAEPLSASRVDAEPPVEAASFLPTRRSAEPGPPGATRARRRPGLLDLLTRAVTPRLEREGGVPSALLDEIHAGNCVAFVGAGFSAAARLPTWGELLQEVADRAGVARATRAHVADRVETGSAYALDEAAQLLEDELGRARFLAQLEALLGHPPMTETMARRVAWLRGTPFRSILTTNFDGILQGATPGREAYRNALRPASYRWWEPRYWGEAQGAFTLKLHGDLTQRRHAEDTVVLTRRDYRRRLYEDPAYETFLRAVMATTTVLYMGFSFEDAYLNELRSEILALLGQRRESTPVAYAIVNDVPADTRRHFRQHEGVEILSYDTQGGRDFSGFDAYLQTIHDATNPLLRFARYLEHKRILWVDPHPENNALAFEHLAEAARVAGREGTALVTVASTDEGLGELEASGRRDPFDLVITHWGEGAARDDVGRRVPAAVRLLGGIRTRDLRCPVVIFAAAQHAEQRKRTALGLGAQAYCFSFEGLYRTIERVLAPGEEEE